MSLTELAAQAGDSFKSKFSGEFATVAFAPGRVELLGNHTDYNGGLVLAAAIDRFTLSVGRADPGPFCGVRSLNFAADDSFRCDERGWLDAAASGNERDWRTYVRGVVWALTERRKARGGFRVAVVGDVPLGAGLSSSASLQASLATFLIGVGFVDGPDGASDDDRRMALARVLQRGENAFVGVASGLLDQFTVLFGRAGHAVVLDCRDLAHERVSLGPSPPALVICDSKTSRRLADGMYNRRRAECETVVAHFRERRGPEAVRWLRDVTAEDLDADWDALDPVGRRRARHVQTENDRVRLGAEALKAGDVRGLGRLLSASHASSRDDFENSSPALDALIEAAEVAPGFLGGKLSGAGWAGCTVNLVEPDRTEQFAEAVAAGYARRAGRAPDVHVCHAADGAAVV